MADLIERSDEISSLGAEEVETPPSAKTRGRRRRRPTVIILASISANERVRMMIAMSLIVKYHVGSGTQVYRR